MNTSLPSHAEAQIPMRADAPRAAAEAVPWATLLVVDDQPINVRALCDAFSGSYRVLMATGGIEALRICREQLPDLVLLDVVMPDLGGHDVCRQLKADALTREIPVIFVTAQDEPGQQTSGLELGAVDFISKPVNAAVVRARVRTQLALSRTSRQLAQMNETLEARILERTHDLEEALQLAAVASRAKSRFLSNMSHEVRTPINGVIGMAYLTLRTELAPAQRDYVEKIHASGTQLLEVVDDILDFSAIEAGSLSLEDAEFELSQVFDAIAVRMQAAARARSLTLHFDLDPEIIAALRGDAVRITHVLSNYVGNAIKFSDRGDVCVSATRVGGLDDAGEILFEVSDEGNGMEPAQVAELFRPFEPGDASTTRLHGGTGLGLAICRQLARLMGGEAGAHSVPGVGSTFWFKIPLRFAQVDSADVVEVDSGLATRQACDAIRGARILVAEDNLINRELSIALLETVGAVVDVVEDGRQAVDESRRERYDLILMDVQMPVMDGMEATRLIRAHPETAETVVLALTANANRDDCRGCFDSGMNDVISKPVVPDVLYAALARWLARRTDGPAPCNGDPAEPEMATVTDAKVVDLPALARCVGSDLDTFRRFARLFLESAECTFKEVENTLAKGASAGLDDPDHRFETSSRRVEPSPLIALCEALEGMRTGAGIPFPHRHPIGCPQSPQSGRAST